ncbi:MAG TPA: serine hydrolase [Xanthomonadales bacterium]|nr:serine hydrolase [Xanthomonadales bacterium]
MEQGPAGCVLGRDQECIQVFNFTLEVGFPVINDDEFDELVSPEQSQMMREAMSEPGIKHKFVKGLDGHDDLQLYRKSGTWRDFHADSMLVEMDGQAYVMVALARSKAGGATWMESLAEPLHRLATSPPATNTAAGPTTIGAVIGPAP